jgi:hypothetical protein
VFGDEFSTFSGRDSSLIAWHTAVKSATVKNEVGSPSITNPRGFVLIPAASVIATTGSLLCTTLISEAMSIIRRGIRPSKSFSTISLSSRQGAMDDISRSEFPMQLRETADPQAACDAFNANTLEYGHRPRTRQIALPGTRRDRLDEVMRNRTYMAFFDTYIWTQRYTRTPAQEELVRQLADWPCRT